MRTPVSTGLFARTNERLPPRGGSRRRRVEELACMESIRLSKVRVRLLRTLLPSFSYENATSLSEGGYRCGIVCGRMDGMCRRMSFVLDRRGRRSLQIRANRVRKSLSSSTANAVPLPRWGRLSLQRACLTAKTSMEPPA